MLKAKTELKSKLAQGIDTLDATQALAALLDGQLAAVQSLRSCSPAITKAAMAAASSIQSGGSLCYVGAGSSGLMALSDSLELTGTFGVPMSQIKILFAGAPDTLVDMRGGAEDDTDLAISDVKGANLKAGDCAILVSASGNTPYTVAAQQELKKLGITTIAIANNNPSALLNNADIAIHLDTPPEIIAGSTRLGAGTAQKIALNMVSTLMGIELGHIHDGLMVNLKADNAKLVERSLSMVKDIAQCDLSTAKNMLQQAKGNVKLAVLLAAGAQNEHAAERMLIEHGGVLRKCLEQIQSD
ncbi:N-acetylmuramic acid 6-phosphate etherase [Ahrensia kielensis]|uniref:N-acetylmuramic acid 6-phosphate etherase n=1 Tax=Ahrensia kielensis TaxID=76980 RepID=UPI00037BF82B|nr:N-acetylmuramic acid 6-phosphate etherase [Ahrensia kielensis]